jgi:deoxyhypusine synthase
VARIYDVFIADDDTLMATDTVILDAVKDLDTSKPVSTAALHHSLGKAIWKEAPHPEKSMVAAAAKYDVPIYTSSPGDSSIGMNLVVPYLFDRPIHLNPILDVIETAAIVRDADINGVVEIGGGSPKNFYLQTQPTLHQILLDRSKGGHDYFLQLTTDSPQWGGLSGATPSEARSWGKLKDAYNNNVVVYSCASITFPLIAQYALARAKPRPHRRLFTRIDEVTEVLRATARENPELRKQHPDLFGDG